MEQRNLGRTGLQVSELCLGAMYFGSATDDKTAFEMLERFTAAGGTFIDTADVYNAGQSEEVLGRWLKNTDRDSLVIATKVRGRMGEGPNDVGLSRKHITAAVEASLRRLGTDYIDLYQTHVFDSDTPLEETLSTLDSLVRDGKVRYIGASNLTGWQLQKAVDLSDRHGLERYVCLQPLYNLLDREIEWDLLEVCAGEGIGVIPWSPLRAGWLAGKFTRDMSGPGESTRVEATSDISFDMSWEQYDNERTWAVLDVLREVATETGKSMAQVATRWLCEQPLVTAPIMGARTLAQLDDSLGAAGWRLTTEQLTKLDEVSHKPRPYPFNVVEHFRNQR